MASHFGWALNSGRAFVPLHLPGHLPHHLANLPPAHSDFSFSQRSGFEGQMTSTSTAYPQTPTWIPILHTTKVKPPPRVQSSSLPLRSDLSPPTSSESLIQPTTPRLRPLSLSTGSSSMGHKPTQVSSTQGRKETKDKTLLTLKSLPQEENLYSFPPYHVTSTCYFQSHTCT